MIQGCEDLGFPLESREAIGIIGERIRQDFDRDVAPQLRIAGPIHFTHGARADRPDDFVRTYATTGGEDWVRWASGPSMLKAADRGYCRRRRRTSTATRRHDAGLRRHRSPRPERRRARRIGRCRGGLKQRLHARPVGRRSRSNFGAELTIQPRFRGSPIALRGRWRHAEYVGGFLDRESAKRTKLDDPGQFSVDLFEAIERAIEREDRDLAQTRHIPRFVDRHTAHAVASFARGVTTGVIDQNPAHHLRRDTEEMRSILPVDLRAGRQAAGTPREPGRSAAACGRPVRREAGASRRGGAPRRRAAAADRAHCGSPRLQSPSSAVTSGGETKLEPSSISWIGSDSIAPEEWLAGFLHLTHSGPVLRDLHIEDALKASGLGEQEK